MTAIRRDDLIAGVRMSIANGRDYFNATLTALDGGLLRPAGTAFGLAIQEIGKAKLLSDAYATGAPRPDIPIYNHAEKVVAAQTVLGSSAMWYSVGGIDANPIDSLVINGGSVPANEPTRLEVTYLNYGTTGWKQPPRIDATELRSRVKDALALLPAIETRLTGTTEGIT